MAGYKRVVLMEKDNSVKETVVNEEPKNSLKKQLDKFDNSYTAKKLNELYDEFDAITFDAPSISSTTLSQIKENTLQKEAVSFKTKLYLASGILITLLMAFLVIFNIFVINNLNTNINSLQEEVATTEYDFQQLYSEYNNLRSTDNIYEKINNKGFSELASGSIININLVDTSAINSYTVESNWFDKFCDFIRRLFGG